MASHTDFGDLSLSDQDPDTTEDLFASPSRLPKPKSRPAASTTEADPSPLHAGQDEEDAIAAHSETLRRELTSLRAMNSAISGVTASLTKAKDNLDMVSTTVENASTLLTTWTRILSQTEHNQRLLLDRDWQGASQDLADAENDEVLLLQERDRREAEEARLLKVREAEREDAERRKAVESATGSGAVTGRGRGRGRVRGSGYGRGSATSAAYVGVGGQGGRGGGTRASRGAAGGSNAKTSSGIGRGTATGRSRGKVV